MKRLNPSARSSLRRHAFLLIGLAFSAFLVLPPLLSPSTGESRRVETGTSLSSIKATPSLATRPIEQIQVGDRVSARNPEISDEQRSTWVEPNWDQWVQLSLMMPKDDGSELTIELLRPESWVLNALTMVVERNDRSAINESAVDSSIASIGEETVPLSPMREVFREVALASADARDAGFTLMGFMVEMNLPELGISGPASVTNMRPSPTIDPGPGHVVTATFHHTSGAVIDLTLADRGHPEDRETIGTTSNHPFWSVDRDEYVQAGSLLEGERLTTLHGDTRVVTSIVARDGSEPVYNLEVFGEHVYFVGVNGVLTHNSKNYAGNQGELTASREGGLAPKNAELPRTLSQQRELSRITSEVREELVSNFDVLARELSPDQIRAIADEPWRMQLFFGTALEGRVAARVRDTVRSNPGSVLSDIVWTGRTNAPQDFIGPGQYGFDITGNSLSSIRSHFARAEVDAVITYESIPRNLGFRFIRWFD